MTAISIIAFINDGNPLMPPFSIAITKGDDAASTELDPVNNLGLLYGTRHPLSGNIVTYENVINQKVLFAAFGIISLRFLLSAADRAFISITEYEYAAGTKH